MEQILDIKVIRLIAIPKRTFSIVALNGMFCCYAIEDQLRQPGVKVAKETCIPAGKYEVKMTFSNRFQIIMPEVQNVPMFSGIRIHPGNYEVDTEGCLCPGTAISDDLSMVSGSKIACANLTARIATAAKKGFHIPIEYINACAIPE